MYGFEFPPDVVGARIVRFGTLAERVEAGLLVIDYMPKGRNEVRRLRLAFNDMGMWVDDPSEDKAPESDPERIA